MYGFSSLSLVTHASAEWFLGKSGKATSPLLLQNYFDTHTEAHMAKESDGTPKRHSCWWWKISPKRFTQKGLPKRLVMFNSNQFEMFLPIEYLIWTNMKNGKVLSCMLWKNLSWVYCLYWSKWCNGYKSVHHLCTSRAMESFFWGTSNMESFFTN